MRMAERKRNFAMGMVALAEERKVCGMTAEEHSRRWRELWKDCFGDRSEPVDLSLANINTDR